MRALTLRSQKTGSCRYAWNSEGLEMATHASFQARRPLPRNAMLTRRAKIACSPCHGGGGCGTCTAHPSEKGPCHHVWHLQCRATQSLIIESTKIVSFFTPSSKLQNLYSILYLLCKKESYSPRATEHIYVCPVYQGPAWMVQAGRSLTPKKARPATVCNLEDEGWEMQRPCDSHETLLPKKSHLDKAAFWQKL